MYIVGVQSRAIFVFHKIKCLTPTHLSLVDKKVFFLFGVQPLYTILNITKKNQLFIPSVYFGWANIGHCETTAAETISIFAWQIDVVSVADIRSPNVFAWNTGWPVISGPLSWINNTVRQGQTKLLIHENGPLITGHPA